MCNEILRAISDRRSIRTYTEEPVSEAQLDAMMTAAMEAPSARNTQPWHITAVSNAELLSRVNQAYCAEFLTICPPEARARIEHPGYSVFFHAPMVLFFSCPPVSEMRYAQTDVGIAIQSVALAAHGLGLGSVILGQPRFAFQGVEADALRAALRFPAGYDFCLAISIGYPACTKEAHPMGEGRLTRIE
ncbi:MAG: nitroreductase [Clostridia bacterium]|nr:nitroreductase [Clostridia bacterium]